MTADIASHENVTIRRDGFPELVGLFCYQCLPPSLLLSNFTEYGCTNDPDRALRQRQTIECTYDYDYKGDPVPIRGCYVGKTCKKLRKRTN